MNCVRLEALKSSVPVSATTLPRGDLEFDWFDWIKSRAKKDRQPGSYAWSLI